MKSRNVAVCLAGLMIGSLIGCSQSIGPSKGAMARSRQITQLEGENAKLQRQISDLQARQDIAESDTDAEEMLSGLAVPVELKLTRGSEVRSGTSPTATVRFETLDLHGRFVQVTGPVEVVLVAMDANGDGHRLIKVELTEPALQTRLRSGFMGMAYAVETPIFKAAAAWIPPVGSSVMARLTVHDARLKNPLEVEKLISVLLPRAE